MDKQTLIISQGMQDLIKQNKETNAQLRQLNQPSDLGISTRENLGEILTSIATSQREIKNETNIAKGHNLGIGVTAKNGINIAHLGGEPKVDEKLTLYGISKEFYGRNTIGNLIESTKEVSKNVVDFSTKDMKRQKAAQKLSADRDKSSEKNKSKRAGFFMGMARTSGLTSSVRGIKNKTSDMSITKGLKKLGKFIAPVRIGMAIGKVLGAPFRLIGRGFSILKNTLGGLLKGVLKGIISLPKKLLSFVGSTFSMLGRIAMLGLGIYGLSKLSQFLRNVTPEEREKLVESFVNATLKFRDAIVKLADFIVDDLIPMLTDFMYAFLNNGLVRFFFGGMYSEKLNKFLEKRNRGFVVKKEEEQIEQSKVAVTKLQDRIDKIEAIPEGERTLSQRARLKSLLEIQSEQVGVIKESNKVIKKNLEEVKVDAEGNAIKIANIAPIDEASQKRIDEVTRRNDLKLGMNDPSLLYADGRNIITDNSTNLSSAGKQILLQQHWATTYNK